MDKGLLTSCKKPELLFYTMIGAFLFERQSRTVNKKEENDVERPEDITVMMDGSMR
jgi:hypothetical protein